MPKLRYATSLTGGGVGALDAKAVGTLSDADICMVATGATLYVFKFVAAATDAEASPNRIRPDDYATAGVWYLQSVGDQTPIGSVLAIPFSAPPTGYLECDGSAISRSTYANLYTIIGTTYGAGNGSTTFNIPDYRGQFLRGWAHGQTTDPDRATRTNRGDGTTGDNVGTRQADEFKSHTHPFFWDEVNPGGSTLIDAAYGDSLLVRTDIGLNGGNETRPRNVNVMFCIKY